MLIFAVVMLVAALVAVKLERGSYEREITRLCGKVSCQAGDLARAADDLEKTWRLYRAWESRYNRLVQKIRSVGAEG
jgi:hypothetical protein